MNAPRKRSPRLSATGLFLILIIAYLITLLGAKDIFGYESVREDRMTPKGVVVSRDLSQ